MVQLFVVVVVALAGLAFAASVVFGVHDNDLFELDVNTSVSPVVGDANTVDDPA